MLEINSDSPISPYWPPETNPDSSSFLESPEPAEVHGSSQEGISNDLSLPDNQVPNLDSFLPADYSTLETEFLAGTEVSYEDIQPSFHLSDDGTIIFDST